MEFTIDMIPTGSLFLLFGMVFLASVVDSIAGGGGLISIPAYMFTGMPVHWALGTNKLTAGMGTLMATFQFFKKGVLEWKIAVISAVFSFIGSTIGTNIALIIDPNTIKKMMIIIIPVVSVIVLIKKNVGEEDHSSKFTMKEKLMLGALIGLMIGFYDGVIGPGTGTFAMMGYCMLMKYDMRTASGNAKLLNLASNTASIITFALADSIMYAVALPCICLSLTGGFIGSRLAIKGGAKFIRPVMVVVLIMIVLQLAADALA